MDNRHTRIQIVRILRERGWTKKRTLWCAPKRRGYYGIHRRGVSLRDAASLEALSSSESLDPPLRRHR